MDKKVNNNSFNEADDNEIDLREIFFRYFRYWKWFIISVVIALLLGLFVYLKMDRRYEVSSSILLKEDKGAGSQGGNSPLSQLEGLGLLSTTNNIDNEIAVLSSPNLMRQIVASLGLYTTYFKKGFIRDAEIYDASPFTVKLEGIKADELKGSIFLKIIKTDSNFEIEGIYSYKKEETDFSTNLTKLPGYVDLPEKMGRLYIDNPLIIQKDDPEEDDSGTYYVKIQNIQNATNDLVSILKIAPTTKNSSVLDLKIVAQNAPKAIDILTELVKIYNKNNVSENNEMALNTSTFVKGRLDTIEVQLKQIENAVVDFKKQQGITDISSEAKLYLDQIGTVEQNRIEFDTQLKVIELVEAYTKSLENKYKMIPNLGITDPTLAGIISSYNSLLLEYEQLDRSTSQNSPARQRVLANLNTTREGIQASINNVKSSINISRREVEKQSTTLTSRVQSVPEQERGLLEIMRQQQTKQALYLYLMQVGEQSSITMASTSDKAKIITDPIIPDQPVSPKRNIILLAAFLLGIIIPVVVIYIKESLQVNIRNREELEKLSSVDVIGEIIKKDEDELIVVRPNKTTPIVELFRTLRNNVQFILDSPEKKVILVTSTVPGEGKTFVSINLAASFTLSQKKVLLIGLDVRNPKLAIDMGFRKGPGLTSFLSGSETDWRTLLTSVKDYTNLDILQAGAIPPNPNELLMKPSLKQLMNEARKIYDVIIIDSAPIGVVSDTFLLNNLADTTVYVTRENVTPKNAVLFINELHKDKKLPNMYLVINGVDLSKNKTRNSRYGYGYTYGYGESK